MNYKCSTQVLFVLTILPLVLFTQPSDVFAQTTMKKSVIVLDPGHDPEMNGNFKKSGVIGTCGQAEYIYNDLTTDALALTLSRTSDFDVVRTRQSGRAVDFGLLKKMPPPSDKRTLYARPAIANAVGCKAYVAIHHDSTSEKNKMTAQNLCLDPSTHQKKPGLRLSDAFLNQFRVGYNVFISRSKRPTAHDRDSLRLATLIAKRIREMGRLPSNYHAKVKDCATCRDINPELGVMTQSLAVLRLARCPAVLIEVGNVVDPTDEKIVNTPEFRSHFATQVQLGLEDFFNAK